MVGQSLPRSSDQLALYRAVLDAAGAKPVTFRTLDIGGDKALPYMETVDRGKSGARLARDPARARPAGPVARPDPRAAARRRRPRAAHHVSDDLRGRRIRPAPRRVVERELTYLRQHGHALPERIDVGTMVEVPALLYQLDELLERRSISSRSAPTTCSSSCSRSTAATPRCPSGSTSCRRRSCARCARSCARPAAAKKSASLCGEMASKPIGALALIALGYRSLSLSATAHGPVKAMILDLDAGKAEAMMMPLLDAPSGSVSIRAEADGIRRGRGAGVVARLSPTCHQRMPASAIRDRPMSMLPKPNSISCWRTTPRSRRELLGQVEFRDLRADHPRTRRAQSADRRGEGLPRRGQRRSPTSRR